MVGRFSRTLTPSGARPPSPERGTGFRHRPGETMDGWRETFLLLRVWTRGGWHAAQWFLLRCPRWVRLPFPGVVELGLMSEGEQEEPPETRARLTRSSGDTQPQLFLKIPPGIPPPSGPGLCQRLQGAPLSFSPRCCASHMPGTSADPLSSLPPSLLGVCRVP